MNKLQYNIRFIGDLNINSDKTVLICTSKEFFKFYITHIMIISSELYDIHFHINIIGNNIKEDLIYDAIELRESINVLKKRKNNNISFSIEKIPNEVYNEVIYYRCSRYLNAKYFMDKFNTDIYIIDIDSTFIDSPNKDFKKFIENDITIFKSQKDNRILSKYMYIKSSYGAIQFIDILRRYILDKIYDKYIENRLDEIALIYTVDYIKSNNLNISVYIGDEIIDNKHIRESIYKSLL